ncbi:MAG: hypothetical protein IJN29_09045 [Akkermansia sp.]|nr:hypothetical protein [Akkermansia sp.]
MKLTDTDLSLRDREWVESVLAVDEELRLVCKPQVRLWRWEYLPVALFAFVWISVVCAFTVSAVPRALEDVWDKPGHLLILLFMLPFWLVSLCFILSPWRLRTVGARTMYLMTNRRALVLAPSLFLLHPTQKEYPLEGGLIREVREAADGSGDVVLDYEERHSKNGVYYVPVGFMHVPQVRRVEEVMRDVLLEEMKAPLPTAPAEDAAETSADEEQEKAPFPNIFLLIVGGVFLIVGGYQVYEVVHHVWSGQPAHWLAVSVMVGIGVLFGYGGGRAVWQWIRDVVKFCRRKRNKA